MSLRLTHKFSAYMKIRKAFKLKYVTSTLEQHSNGFSHILVQEERTALGKLLNVYNDNSTHKQIKNFESSGSLISNRPTSGHKSIVKTWQVKKIKLKQNLIMGEIKPRWFIWTLLCVFVTWTFTTGWIKGITVITCSQLIKQKLGQPKTVSQVVSLENRENGR